MPLRMAVVGVGSGPSARARQYLETLAHLRDLYSLCALCDVDEATVQAVAGHYKTTPYTDLRRMLDTEKPDVVLCLPPTDAQPVVALTVAVHGVHLITEIPYGITLTVGDAIAEACQKNGVLWEVAEQVWLWPHEQMKRKGLQAQLIGKVTHAHLAYSSGSYHGFNALRSLLGAEPKRVLGYAQEVPTRPYIAYGGDAMKTRIWEHALIEFENNVVCLFEKPLRPTPNHWELEGTQGHLAGNAFTLYREREELRYEIQETYLQKHNTSLLSGLRLETNPPITWENPFIGQDIGTSDDIAKASLLAGMHRAITEKGKPLYGPENARRDLEIAFALWESLRRNNQWVHLPLTERPTELERHILEAYRRQYGFDPVEEATALLSVRFGRKSVWWSVAQWL